MRVSVWHLRMWISLMNGLKLPSEADRGFQVSQRYAVMTGIMLFQAAEVEGLGDQLFTGEETEALE